LDGDEPERVQSGSSSGDERVVGRGHQSRADSAPRRRRVLPDVDVATADLQTAITAKPGKYTMLHKTPESCDLNKRGPFLCNTYF